MGIYDRVLITGGAGMLAKALIRVLREHGIDSRSPARAELDIANEKQLGEELRNFKPTLVLNCAAYTKVDLCEDSNSPAEAINGAAVADLAFHTRGLGAKLVHFSTDFVFDGQSKQPYKPEDKTNPLSGYGRSKLRGEQEIQRLPHLQHLIIRTAWLYGPGGACFPQTILNAARAGKPLKVVDDQIGSPTFAFDLAEATLNLIDANATGIYHVVNSGHTNWHDFTSAILDEFNVKAELSRTTSAQWKELRPTSAIRPAYSVLDTSEYAKITGKTMRPWQEALHAYRILQ
jgi:dTDP-4-dehydrorhamnose reductase